MRQNPDWRPIESAPKDGTWIAVRESQNTLMGGDHMAAWIYGIWRDEENPTGKWWNGRHVVERPIEWSPAWSTCRQRPQDFVNRALDESFLADIAPKPELFAKTQPKTGPIHPDLLFANRLRVRAKMMQALMDEFLRTARDNGLTMAQLADRLEWHDNNMTAEFDLACEGLHGYADIAFALGMDLEILLVPESDQ